MYKYYDLFFVILVLTTIICEVMAHYFFKKSTNNSNKNLLIFLGIILYSIVGSLAYLILQYGEIGVINLIWHLVYFIMLFIIGYIFLDEKMSVKKIVACIFGLISLTIFLLDE
tara:strand:+ start:1561 stop:1899 length:339 start_codon:yes stop_codon:yes gene_type:complete